jgi:hypothetical protein
MNYYYRPASSVLGVLGDTSDLLATPIDNNIEGKVDNIISNLVWC